MVALATMIGNSHEVAITGLPLPMNEVAALARIMCPTTIVISRMVWSLLQTVGRFKLAADTLFQNGDFSLSLRMYKALARC